MIDARVYLLKGGRGGRDGVRCADAPPLSTPPCPLNTSLIHDTNRHLRGMIFQFACDREGQTQPKIATDRLDAIGDRDICHGRSMQTRVAQDPRCVPWQTPVSMYLDTDKGSAFQRLSSPGAGQTNAGVKRRWAREHRPREQRSRRFATISHGHSDRCKRCMVAESFARDATARGAVDATGVPSHDDARRGGVDVRTDLSPDEWSDRAPLSIGCPRPSVVAVRSATARRESHPKTTARGKTSACETCDTASEGVSLADVLSEVRARQDPSRSEAHARGGDPARRLIGCIARRRLQASHGLLVMLRDTACRRNSRGAPCSTVCGCVLAARPHVTASVLRCCSFLIRSGFEEGAADRALGPVVSPFAALVSFEDTAPSSDGVLSGRFAEAAARTARALYREIGLDRIARPVPGYETEWDATCDAHEQTSAASGRSCGRMPRACLVAPLEDGLVSGSANSRSVLLAAVHIAAATHARFWSLATLCQGTAPRPLELSTKDAAAAAGFPVGSLDTHSAVLHVLNVRRLHARSAPVSQLHELRRCASHSASIVPAVLAAQRFSGRGAAAAMRAALGSIVLDADLAHDANPVDPFDADGAAASSWPITLFAAMDALSWHLGSYRERDHDPTGRSWRDARRSSALKRKRLSIALDSYLARTAPFSLPLGRGASVYPIEDHTDVLSNHARVSRCQRIPMPISPTVQATAGDFTWRHASCSAPWLADTRARAGDFESPIRRAMGQGSGSGSVGTYKQKDPSVALDVERCTRGSAAFCIVCPSASAAKEHCMA